MTDIPHLYHELLVGTQTILTITYCRVPSGHDKPTKKTKTSGNPPRAKPNRREAMDSRLVGLLAPIVSALGSLTSPSAPHPPPNSKSQSQPQSQSSQNEPDDLDPLTS